MRLVPCFVVTLGSICFYFGCERQAPPVAVATAGVTQAEVNAYREATVIALKQAGATNLDVSYITKEYLDRLSQMPRAMPATRPVRPKEWDWDTYGQKLVAATKPTEPNRWENGNKTPPGVGGGDKPGDECISGNCHSGFFTVYKMLKCPDDPTGKNHEFGALLDWTKPSQ